MMKILTTRLAFLLTMMIMVLLILLLNMIMLKNYNPGATYPIFFKK